MAIITKKDCLDLLFDLQKRASDDEVNEIVVETNRLLRMKEPDLSTIKFINDRRAFDVREFYEHIRRSYNQKKSKLYKNIVTVETLEPREMLMCLGSLQLQALIYYHDLEDRQFLKHIRFNSICDCLKHFYETGDFIPCQRLLALIKADLKLFETISKE